MITLKRVSVKRKIFTKFLVNLRSRHPSHKGLKKLLPKMPFRSVVRLGSSWSGDNHQRVEINSLESIKNSSNKLRMKECFTRDNIKTAEWCTGNQRDAMHSIGFPIVAKSHYGSRGIGNTLLNDFEEFENWVTNKNLNNYIFERFYNYSKEYRLHVTEDGCFYTCRKMIKQEFKNDSNAWQRHNDNCVWIIEDNPLFEKPTSWNDIVQECVKAIKSVGLDIGALDVKVQSNTNKKGEPREYVNFIILETNSAPSFGEGTEQKYLIEIPRLLNKKKNGSVSALSV